MSMIKLLRTKYGSIPLERNNEGYFTCFFNGCCQKIAGDWIEHIKAHELAGDTIDYSLFVTQPSDYLSTSSCPCHLRRSLKHATTDHIDCYCPHDSPTHKRGNTHTKRASTRNQQHPQQHSISTGFGMIPPRGIVPDDTRRFKTQVTFDKLLCEGTKPLQDIPTIMCVSEGLMRKNVHSFYQYSSDTLFGDTKQGPERVYQKVTEFQGHTYSPLGPSWANYPPPVYTLPQHAATSAGECSLPQDCYPAQSFLGTVTPTGDLAPPPVYAVAEQDVSTLTDPGTPFFVGIRGILIKLENFITDNSQEFSGPEKFQFELAAIDKALEEGKYKFVKDVADSLGNIWDPLVEANGQHNIAIVNAIKEVRAQLDELCAKEREKVDERVREDENSCNFTPNDTCAICRKGGDLFFCSGACHRCYHVECLGNLEAAFSTNHICPQCFHGKPVLHYDTKKGGFCYFSYRRRRRGAGVVVDDDGDERDSALSKREFCELEEKATKVLLRDGERKTALRRECEESRINTMYYDPIWCTWRSKSERHTKDRYDAAANAQENQQQKEVEKEEQQQEEQENGQQQQEEEENPQQQHDTEVEVEVEGNEGQPPQKVLKID